MKILLYGIAIALCLVLPPHQYTLTARETSTIAYGERPPIDIDRVPVEAYEPGKFLIKISPGLSDIFGRGILHAGSEDYVVSGIPSIDSANREFGVKSYKPWFESLYETNSKTSKYRERHEAWGFHLWYELKVYDRENIIEAVKRFSALDEITYAEPFYKVRLVFDDPAMNSSKPAPLDEPEGGRWTPNDPHYLNQWHYNNTGQQGGTPGADIDLQNAWDIENGNADVIVAIVDGGIDYTHNDIAANMWDGIGFNFVNNSSTIIPHNHGTHVAGTVAAVSNNSIGVAGVAGGSGSGDGVRLMSCQVFTSSGSGGFHIAPVYAADNGAAISQNSWGYTAAGVYSQPVLDAIDYFNLHGGGNALNGGITFFAAGNANSSGQWYPACYPGAFSIAGTNNQDKKAWYSNYDTWVDISAPGGETNSVMARGVLSTLNGNSYGYYQGTSMACPHASGTAALMASLGYGELTAEQVAEILRNTTDNHYPVNPTFTGKLGTGRLNAHNALIDVFSLLTGVANPYNFEAFPESNSQINLSWQKNFDNDDILLVFSADSIHWTPQNGEIYTAGQTLPDGSDILYSGGETEFSHDSLDPATTYYYRIFSYNTAHEYSTGRLAVASTYCNHVDILPFIENFNATTSLPVCWEIADHIGNGQVWEFGRGAYLIGSTTNYAYVNSDAYGSGNSQNADLITVALDLSSFTGVTLTFRHYFRAFSSSMARLYYSIDNGENWTLLQTWSSSTSNPAIFSEPVPELDGQYNVRLKWKYTASFGYYWSVDDVEVTGVSSDLILGNILIPSNIDTCMFATQSIFVAGDGTTFTIEDGGNIELVAGESISYLDGTHVHAGAYMLGRISTNGEFCVNPESILSLKYATEQLSYISTNTYQSDFSFKVFPNPGNGRFTLQLSEHLDSDLILVEIYSLMGKLVGRIELNEPLHVFDISEEPDGLYMLRVSNGEHAGFTKLIKN
jgi:hypothetical protein